MIKCNNIYIYRIKLNPLFPFDLDSQIEEGLCQLVAYLWLEYRKGLKASTRRASLTESDAIKNDVADDDLRNFFIYQIETDTNPIYGDGFRAAAAAYSSIGLDQLLYYVRTNLIFPT